MGIFVKGMDMPPNCAKCLLFVNACSKIFLSYLCDATTSGDILSIYGRPDWCPLVEIPTPHGRLIDVDLLKDQFPIWIDSFPSCVVNKTLSKAPTIIEAEGED